jgi:hypothetical protein
MTIVQTTLDEQEYRTLREVLSRQGLSLKEGPRVTVKRLVLEETKLDPSDPFLSSRPTGRSGHRDLSKAHDKHLYGRGRHTLFLDTSAFVARSEIESSRSFRAPSFRSTAQRTMSYWADYPSCPGNSTACCVIFFAAEATGIHASALILFCWVGIPLLRFHPHPSQRRSIRQTIDLTVSRRSDHTHLGARAPLVVVKHPVKPVANLTGLWRWSQRL